MELGTCSFSMEPLEVIPGLSCFTFPCSTGQCSKCLDIPELILGAAQGPEEGRAG